MNKQEVIERLNNKLDEVFAFQRSFKPLTGAHMECESKANAYMTAINYVEQLDEPQKVKVKPFIADWFEEHKDFLELSLGRITPDIRTKIVQGQALSEFEKWFNSTRNEPFETIIRMKNGYEVEEEPQWVIYNPNSKRASDEYLARFADDKLEIPVWRHLGEENPLTFTDRAKAAAVATLVEGSVEEVEV